MSRALVQGVKPCLTLTDSEGLMIQQGGGKCVPLVLSLPGGVLEPDYN